MIVWILKKKKKSKMNILSYIEQCSHGLSFTTQKKCVKFFVKEEAIKTKNYILKEFHTVVLVEPYEEANVSKEIN